VSKNFRVKINNKYTFDIGSEETKEIDLIDNGDLKYHVLNDNESYNVELCGSDFLNKSYVISVNSKEYSIEISNELDALIEKMGYSVNGIEKGNVITAPMPGIIIALNVKKGDVVREGDTVLILEAMKMENSIKCPKDAVVKSVLIEKGNSVEKNKLLIELE